MSQGIVPLSLIGALSVALLLTGGAMGLLPMPACPVNADQAGCAVGVNGSPGMTDCTFCGLSVSAEPPASLGGQPHHAWILPVSPMSAWAFPALPWRPPS